ncbi:MAG: response regulator receiver modulated diguanylate cyclase [Firmicutes bacterium]|nr:response regulator receiver modulated diguanylate cyclase [Bacillota bacterium]
MKTQNDRQNQVMAKARTIFLQEVQRNLPHAQQGLSKLRDHGYDLKTCKNLYRFAHTLKGSGQMVGLKDIAESASEITTALSLVENYRVKLGAGLQKFLAERLEDIVDEVGRLGTEGIIPSREKQKNMLSNNKKVLVVDDDPVITKLVQERLTQEGFVITVCHNSLEAENHLQMEHPDLILLDILMPGENGIEFCCRIRSKEFQQIIPIIFFTVKGELQDKLVGFATGADDYLAKPFAMEELVARIHALFNRLETFHEWAWQDELTKIYNRRYLHRRLQEERFQAKMHDEKFSLAMIDLNLFKFINDNYGHSAGDMVLTLLVGRMKHAFRKDDVICRYGGDEFAVIFPDSNSRLAKLALERLCLDLENTPIELPKNGKVNLTLSIGVSTFPESGGSCDELLAAADGAMYQAKKMGGNKIILSNNND